MARQIGRRAFLQQGSLILAAAGLGAAPLRGLLAQDTAPPALKIGLLTDMHYADKVRSGTRYYRETPTKLAEAAAKFADEKINFLVELGDLIDSAATPEIELEYLKTINEKFAAISPDRHYVLGNHCVDMLTKEEFLKGVGQEKSYYSFDRGDFHFVVLDACFTSEMKPYGRKGSVWSDANFTPEELAWLKGDLAATPKRTIILAHQRLDVASQHAAKNAPAVRTILEESKKVLVAFMGHSHQNEYKEINGIHYATLKAMVEGTGVESNGYSVLSVDPQGSLKISGFRTQQNYEWKRA